MPTDQAKKSSPFVVGVSPGENTDELLQFASILSQRTKVPIHLVYVMEYTNWTAGPFYPAMDFPMPNLKLDGGIPAEMRQAGLDFLATCTKKLKDCEAVTTKLMVGDIVDSLNEEVEALDGRFLVVGSNKTRRFFPLGASTAVACIQKSMRPVLIVPHTGDLKLAVGEALKMIVLDDLAKECQTLGSVANAFGASLGQCQVTHTHIADFSQIRLNAFYFRQSEEEIEKRVQEYKDDILKVLSERSPYHVDRLEDTDGKYLFSVLEGNVTEELDTIIRDQKPNFLVFGRHKTFHTEGLFFGRVPYSYSLSQGVPVLVVPVDK